MTIQNVTKRPTNIYPQLTPHEKQTKNYLFQLPIFDSFKGDEIDIFARYMNHSMVSQGKYLFLEGDKGNHMCFVVSGLLEIRKKNSNGEQLAIARSGQGESIGEMSFLDHTPRSASVIAKQSSTIVILTYATVDLLSKRHPHLIVTLLKKIMGLLSSNMRNTSSRLADTMST